MSKDNKQRLFEVMERVDPSIKVEQQVQGAEPVVGDATNLQKAIETSPAVKYALSRIDTVNEFEPAMKILLGYTGVAKKKGITISQAQTLLKTAMQSLGFR
jgi:hypothetical protein